MVHTRFLPLPSRLASPCGPGTLLQDKATSCHFVLPMDVPSGRSCAWKPALALGFKLAVVVWGELEEHQSGAERSQDEQPSPSKRSSRGPSKYLA